jgi:hypothetical protein
VHAVEDISSIDFGELSYDIFVKAYNEIREHDGIARSELNKIHTKKAVKCLYAYPRKLSSSMGIRIEGLHLRLHGAEFVITGRN